MYKVFIDFNDKSWSLNEFETKKECRIWVAAMNKKHSKTPVIKIEITKVIDENS